MKVLLINPPTSFEQIYGDWNLSALDTYTPPLGILHVASYIRKHGHEPSILDLQTKDWEIDKIIEYIIFQNPDIVGLSAMTINCLNADKIAAGLKSNNFPSPIILGGSHISAVPVETLERFKEIDYGILGEGEITFFKLIEKLEQDQSIKDVNGIAWRDDKEEIIINEPRPPIENLDMLPFPAWDLLDNFPKNYPSSLLESKRLPSASILTSRGCPFHCTFCDNQVFGSKARHFSAEYVMKMIRHLKTNYGIKDLMFLDDNLLINKKKLFDICNAMIEEKINLTWYCIGHAKSMTEESLSKIWEAGCWFIELGIESGNNKILASIKKNTNKAELSKAVQNAKKTGLKIKGNFIFGFPEDTPETLEETIQFALDSDIDFFQQNFLTIWPGCEISNQVSKKNIGTYERNWGKLAHQRITFVPDGLSREYMLNASKVAFRRFYMRPKIIFRFLPLLASLRGMKLLFTAFFVFLKTAFRRKKT